MGTESDIKKAIRGIVGGRGPLLWVGQVLSVDGDTCSVNIEDITIEGVRLRSVTDGSEEGLMIVPKVNSYVVVADIGKENLANMVVVAFGDIDGVSIKGGKNGGLVNIETLKRWMANVERDLNTLKTLLSTTPVAGNGAPLGAVFNPTTQSVESDIEDETINH